MAHISANYFYTGEDTKPHMTFNDLLFKENQISKKEHIFLHMN